MKPLDAAINGRSSTELSKGIRLEFSPSKEIQNRSRRRSPLSASGWPRIFEKSPLLTKAREMGTPVWFIMRNGPRGCGHLNSESLPSAKNAQRVRHPANCWRPSAPDIPPSNAWRILVTRLFVGSLPPGGPRELTPLRIYRIRSFRRDPARALERGI